MPLRFLFVAPVAFLALFFFAGYYFFRNSKNGDNKVFMIIPAIVFGIPSVLTNAIWNIFFATFVFWEWPAMKKIGSGKFSPFFSTRLSNRCTLGKDDPTTRWFVWAVNYYDPAHFGGWDGTGNNPYKD